MPETTPTARQIEYALSLGFPNPNAMKRKKLSAVIDKALSKPNGPMTRGQLKVARAFGLEVPDNIKKFDEMVDFLYFHIITRRWIYSVIRHEAKAHWKNYRQAPVDESVVLEIAQELKQEDKPFTKIWDRRGANHTDGGDVWYRITENTKSSKEYEFVTSRLPNAVRAKLAKMARLSAKSEKRAKSGEPSKSGCLLSFLLLFVVSLLGWGLS